jgi:hypothetical protein
LQGSDVLAVTIYKLIELELVYYNQQLKIGESRPSKLGLLSNTGHSETEDKLRSESSDESSGESAGKSGIAQAHTSAPEENFSQIWSSFHPTVHERPSPSSTPPLAADLQQQQEEEGRTRPSRRKIRKK